MEDTKVKRVIDEEMLELDKRDFADKMDYKMTIPKILVKLSNTYFSKLSGILKAGAKQPELSE